MREFWCSTCQKTTQESCDAALVNTTCPKANYCTALWAENVFTRKCVNGKMLELLTKGCKNVGLYTRECKRKKHYHVSWCNQSGCKAQVANPKRREFWCPTCQNTTQQSCDAALTNTTCPKADFCMALWDKNVFTRKCVNKKMLELLTSGCKNVDLSTRECRREKHFHVSWCEQSGCKAQVAKRKKREFWCPTCQNTTEEACDAALVNTTCPKASFCMALWEENVFTRKCVNGKMLELLTKGCKNVDLNARECKRKKHYQVSWCDQSGCKAQVAKPKRREFWCPTCQNTTQEPCDAALTNTTCPKADFCIALWDDNIFVRKCVNKKMLELLTKRCRNLNSNERECNGKRKYHVTWCDHSGCRAKVAKKSDAFWCPTCQNSSPESCDAASTNTTCPKAEFCMAFQDKNVFARKCVNKQLIELMTKGCKNVSNKKWECSGKRQYRVTWCDHSGCRAEVPGIPTGGENVPNDPHFECPTCPMCKSMGECEHKTEMAKCPRSSRCLVLRVNGTNVSESIFARNCINEKAFMLIQRACAKRQGCEMATCTQSGCKALL